MSCIGSTRSHALALIQESGMAPFHGILPSSEFETIAQQTGCTPKRRRRLVPEVVAWLVMYVSLYAESMTQGLVQAWALLAPYCPNLKAEPVSEEAFCQARKRLKLRFWQRLFGQVCSRYEQRFDALMRWKGLRVLAGDGTEVNLPIVSALIRFFGRPKNGKGHAKAPQARLVALCSVFTGFCLTFTFTALRFTEHAALRHVIRRLKSKDLLLLDRGFFSLCHPLENSPTRCRLPHPSVEPSRRTGQSHSLSGSR
jgi:hypothetical protein